MKKNMFGSFIPLITMLVIVVISGAVFDLKGVVVIGVVAIIPLSFLIEGLICTMKSRGFILPLILSLLGFFIVDKMILYMNDDLKLYMTYYTVVYIIGCVIGKVVVIFKNKNK